MANGLVSEGPKLPESDSESASEGSAEADAVAEVVAGVAVEAAAESCVVVDSSVTWNVEGRLFDVDVDDSVSSPRSTVEVLANKLVCLVVEGGARSDVVGSGVVVGFVVSAVVVGDGSLEM